MSGFIVEAPNQIRVIQSKYLPSGTCLIVKDGEVDALIKWLNDSEGMKAEIIRLKTRIAELEYELHQRTP